MSDANRSGIQLKQGGYVHNLHMPGDVVIYQSIDDIAPPFGCTEYIFKVKEYGAKINPKYKDIRVVIDKDYIVFKRYWQRSAEGNCWSEWVVDTHKSPVIYTKFVDLKSFDELEYNAMCLMEGLV